MKTHKGIEPMEEAGEIVLLEIGQTEKMIENRNEKNIRWRIQLYMNHHTVCM